MSRPHSILEHILGRRTPACATLSTVPVKHLQELTSSSARSSHMSIVRHTRTLLMDSPLITRSSDTGFAPLRQPYLSGMDVQEAEPGQNYSSYEQSLSTQSLSGYQIPHVGDDNQLGSPLSLQQDSLSTQPVDLGFESDPVTQHSFTASSPSLDHNLNMLSPVMQQYAQNSAGASMNESHSSYHDQHALESRTDSQQFYAEPELLLDGHNFYNAPYQLQTARLEHVQQINERPYASPSPYPDLSVHTPELQYHSTPPWQFSNSDEDSGGNGDFGYDGKLSTSYAHLIYMCLLEAPNYSRKLKEIYDWIRIRTNKADDLTTNGWQNSVRHNLSMNKVCMYARSPDI